MAARPQTAADSVTALYDARVSKNLTRGCVTESEELFQESGGRFDQAIWRDAPRSDADYGL